MTDLPPLPIEVGFMEYAPGRTESVYTAEQMREYARAAVAEAVAAEREACAKACDAEYGACWHAAAMHAAKAAKRCAAAIRARGDA